MTTVFNKNEWRNNGFHNDLEIFSGNRSGDYYVFAVKGGEVVASQRWDTGGNYHITGRRRFNAQLEALGYEPFYTSHITYPR